ncbi:MAG: metal-sulfur cluster assembly factor [Flavobacteriales bacterium]|nr:metal-sulfur cluster assembly factor [Flavobacteriales bacterium]
MCRERTPKEQELFLKLKGVIDPELMVNIIDLGLVYDVKIDEEKNIIHVEMTLTSPGCPMGDMIMEDIKQLIINNYTEYEPDIQLIWNPPWTLENLTEDGKRFLNR